MRSRGPWGQSLFAPTRSSTVRFAWPEAEVVAFADEDRAWDAGNVNATTIGKTHYLALYHGTRTQTAVIVATARAR